MKIAIVQKAPVINNLGSSLKLLESYLDNASKEAADLVVFGECWLCGYPAWIDYVPEAGFWDHEPVKKVWSDMYNNAISVKSKEFQSILELAKDKKLNIILGANEKIVSGPGNGTMYNTVFIIDNQGQLQNHHRKLMPTHTERLIHGTGDGHGLKAVDMDFGRIGSLICWEHWMPLARQAMHNEAEDIHIALWPFVKEMHIVTSRQYAFEGRCFVVSVGQMLKAIDTPADLALPQSLAEDPEKWVMRGGSCIIRPDGSFLLEPQNDIDDVIYAEIPDVKAFTGEKMNLSVSGHYNRPDVFELTVNRKRIY